MAKKQIQVLVVEDDATQGKAIYEAFKRTGAKTVWCTSSSQALTHAQRMTFDLLVVDCLLPKMNGVDLVEEFLALIPNKPKVLLISGIFKDKTFIADAMKRAKADTFFIKPVDLTELLAHTEKLFAHASSDAPPIMSIYTAKEFDEAAILDLINKESAMHAFHLPKLYQRMMETKVNGELSLINAAGEISSVSFCEGRIFFVKTPDKESFFGSLAVSQGFVTPEDLLDALKDISKKMIGQKLIQSLSLSPHAVQIILNEQLALRLSQTISDQMVTVQWLNRKFPKPDSSLAEDRYEQLLEDWMDSKITADWAKSTFLLWGPFEIQGEYHPRIRGKHTVEFIFSDSHFNDQKDLPILFRALLKGDAFMGERGEQTQDFTFLEARLDKLLKDFSQQNYFQILGLSEKAQMREIGRAFENLKEAFDPTMLPQQCPSELVEKCTRVFKQIEKAKNVLSNEIERMAYLQQMHNMRLQELHEAEPLYRAAVLELVGGHPAEAAKKLDALFARKLEFKDMRSYRIWAGLKCDRKYSDLRLDQIPPEERHSAAYLMAKGVHYRVKGQYKKALDAFRTAHVLDPRLTIAKYELQHLALELEKNRSQNRDVLREVTSVVEGLFGKVRRGA